MINRAGFKCSFILLTKQYYPPNRRSQQISTSRRRCVRVVVWQKAYRFPQNADDGFRNNQRGCL